MPNPTGKRVHGRSHTRTYNVWRAMLNRCNDPKNKRYARYGGRGIAVCERWMDLEKFIEDMGEAPDGLQLDRIDNDGPYDPSNCRWVTQQANRENRPPIRMATIDGTTRTIRQWCREFRISFSTVDKRLRRGADVLSALGV